MGIQLGSQMLFSGFHLFVLSCFFFLSFFFFVTFLPLW
jgi:hypothetical protein